MRAPNLAKHCPERVLADHTAALSYCVCVLFCLCFFVRRDNLSMWNTRSPLQYLCLVTGIMHQRPCDRKNWKELARKLIVWGTITIGAGYFEEVCQISKGFAGQEYFQTIDLCSSTKYRWFYCLRTVKSLSGLKWPVLDQNWPNMAHKVIPGQSAFRSKKLKL